jgi:phospholipid/cholesterol/gamma-HCH transport system substrate-binding protein
MRIEHRAAKLTVLGLFLLACLTMFFFLYRSAGGSLPFQDQYEVKAVLPTSFNIVPNSDVRRAGVKIGKVTDITNRGPNGLVTMQIDKDKAPLYRDATVLLRTKTLVGENYIDVKPGNPKTGKLDKGSTVPIERAGEAVQLDQILDTLDSETRAEIRKNLDGLGPGFDGRGEDVNRLFAAMRPTIVQGGIVAGILRNQKGQVGRLVDNAGELLRAFGDRTQQVRVLARQAKTTAQVVAARDKEFGAAIDELEPTLRQAQFSVDKLGGFSTRATPVFRNLRVASTGLTPLFKDLRPAAYLGRQLFGEIPGLSKNLDPTLSSLKRFSPRLERAIQPIDSVVRQANPFLEYVTPYQREIGAFFGNVGSAVDIQDNISNMAHLLLLFGPSNFPGVLTENEQRAVKALIDAGAIGKFYNVPKHNSYPKPGSGVHPSQESAFKAVGPDPASVGG